MFLPTILLQNLIKQKSLKPLRYRDFLEENALKRPKVGNPKTGKETRHTALINVHDSYHFGRTENCFDCHREHKPSTNQCATCHDIEAWKMPTPK